MSAESKDLLEVFLGGEGMYGVITELTLRLLPKAEEIGGKCKFLVIRGIAE